MTLARGLGSRRRVWIGPLATAVLVAGADVLLLDDVDLTVLVFERRTRIHAFVAVLGTIAGRFAVEWNGVSGTRGRRHEGNVSVVVQTETFPARAFRGHSGDGPLDTATTRSRDLDRLTVSCAARRLTTSTDDYAECGAARLHVRSRAHGGRREHGTHAVHKWHTRQAIGGVWACEGGGYKREAFPHDSSATTNPPWCPSWPQLIGEDVVDERSLDSEGVPDLEG